ncbi:MAG TPA: DUF5937 family protein [Jiangellaceae bacterium]
MIELEVDAGRLAQSRFALSPLAETTNAVEVLAHPERAPYARRWVAGVAQRIRWFDYDVLLAIAEHATGYVPDFIAPIPQLSEPSIGDELAAVAATPGERIRQELHAAFRPADPRGDALDASIGATELRPPMPIEVSEILQRDGERGLAHRLAAQLELFWRQEMAPIWSDVVAVLEDDVRQHAVAAAWEGFATVVDRLHPAVSWDGRRVRVQSAHDATFRSAQGVTLLPSAFLPRPAVWIGPDESAMVGYPARGSGRVWVSREASASDAGMFAGRWALLLRDLDVDRSTADLAARHRLSRSTVSYHLGRLHAAGLVTRQRDRHRVLYRRTQRAGDTLAALGLEGTVEN